MIAAWTVMICETIGNVTVSSDVPDLEIAGEAFMQSVPGWRARRQYPGHHCRPCHRPTPTTFAPNADVIAFSRNASRWSGCVCAFILFLDAAV
jgi:xanthine/uracil permease